MASLVQCAYVMLDSLMDRIVGTPSIWLLVQKVLGYPEAKEAMYRSAIAGRGTLLDFGCSSGHLGRAFAGVEYYGVDTDERGIAAARKRWENQPQMHWICANILDRPFPPGEFDQVLVGCTVHHLSDSALVPILRELAFCLRPNGILHIFDPVRQKKDGIGPRMLRKLDRGKYTRTLDQILTALHATSAFKVEHTAILPAPRTVWQDCDTGYVRAIRLEGLETAS